MRARLGAPLSVDDLTALTVRLARLEDLDQLKRLQRTYMRCLANRDWDGLRQLFIVHPIIDWRATERRFGQQGLTEFVELLARTETTPDAYLLSSPTLAVDGDDATGMWTQHRHVCEFGSERLRIHGPWFEGRVACRYRRSEQGWRIAHLRFAVVAPDPDGDPTVDLVDQLKEGPALAGSPVAGGDEGALSDLTGRLAALEAAEAIKDLHRRYVRAFADGRHDEIGALFTDDAVVDLRTHGPRRGRAEYQALFDAMHAVAPDPGGYLLSSPVITVDGDSARGEWTWHRHVCEFPSVAGPVRAWGPWLEGRYDCTYRDTAAGWRFSGIYFRVVLPEADRR